MPKVFSYSLGIFLVLSFFFPCQVYSWQEKPPKNDSLALAHYLRLSDQLSDRDSTLAVLNRAYARFVGSGYTKGQAKVLHRLGDHYLRAALFPPAKQLFSDASRLLEKLDEPLLLADTYSGLGTVAGRQRQFKEATEYLLDALKIYEEYHNQRGMSSIYLKLGTVNAMLGNHREALDYFNRALPLAEKTDSVTTVTLYNNIGAVYKNQLDYEKATVGFMKSLDKIRQYGLERLKVLPLTNLGQIRFNQGDTVGGLRYIDEGIAVAQRNGLSEELLTLQYQKAAIRSETLPKATLQKLAAIADRADSSGLKQIAAWSLETMISINRKRGNYREVAGLQERLYGIRDSLTKQQQAKEVANLESIYALERSRQTVSKLEERLDRKRGEIRYGIGLLAVAGVGLAFTLVLYRKLRVRNRHLKDSKGKLQEVNRTKDRLFAIIGHDLINGLSSLPQALWIAREPEVPPEQRDTLLEMIEKNLTEVNFTLETLLKWGRLVIKGEVINPSRFAFHAVVGEEIAALDHRSVTKQVTIGNRLPEGVHIFGDEAHFRFVVRNLLANAIKYSWRGGSVHVSAADDAGSGTLLFLVSDYGVGMSEREVQTIFRAEHTSIPGSEGEKGNAIALSLCKAFVEKNGGQLWVESIPDAGSTFKFTFGNNPVTAPI